MPPRSSRSLRVAPEHIERVRLALRRHAFPSQKSLAEELGISRSTTDRFFTGKPVDYLYFLEITERLGLDWHAIAYIEEDPSIKVEPPLPSDSIREGKSENKGVGIDWRQVCRDMLEAQNQRRLTTNPLTAGDGVAFELDEIYVPLGLVERKQRYRRSGDVSPEQGSRIYKPEISDEITKTFQQDEFFEQVLRQGRSRRIAIIGEPGAGKTTLLQKIAAWVLDNTDDVPIWISLADLQGKSFKAYLLSDWLENAIRTVQVSEEIQKALGELFNSGRVWLLLDAVDEMTLGAYCNTSLQGIANQISGWVADARVMLTCRLNVWDAGKNSLEAFETYRNLDFSYGDAQTPDQVDQFIRCWFKGNLVLAERLRAELDQPGRERIKDAVKNPLRLALLCRSWILGQGGLPNTKAGLYQQFIEALYEWKQERFPTNSTQRQELNKALGELALRAISEEKTKFRLRDRFVCSVLGKPDEELFQLALQLGWLNQVGLAAEAENRGEKVYAFFHPTLQEYFAAQAVENWQYFLNDTSDNPTRGTYHIFEQQWKEVILLWLGREDLPLGQKEAFIKALVEFEDGCKGFYRYRAYFLAAVGIAEFRDCIRADEIAVQLVKWSFGDFNDKKQQWMTFPEPIEKGASSALIQTDRRRAITVLVELIESTPNQHTCREIARRLGEIGAGNQTAISVLVQLIKSTEDNLTLRQAVDSLGKIGAGNQTAISVLVELVKSIKHDLTRSMVAESLGKIGVGNQTAISVLVEIIKSTKHKFTGSYATYSLDKIDPENQTVIADLVQLIKLSKIEQFCRQAAHSLGTIDPGNPEAIAGLMQLLRPTKDESMRRKVADSLRNMNPGNPTAIPALVQILQSTDNESIDNESIRWRVTNSLGKIGKGNPEASAALVQLLESTKAESIRWKVAHSLGKIGYGNQTAIRGLVQLLESTDAESTLGQAAESLGKIGYGNQTAIRGLVQLIESTDTESTLGQAAESLGTIDPGNQIAIKTLVQLLESTQKEFTHREVAESLGKIDPGNQIAIKTLVQLIKSSEDEYTVSEAAESLQKILQDEQLAGIVTALKDYLSDERYENDRKRFDECYKVIWHCAQNMTYPAFYQAWHNQAPPIQMP